MSNEKENRTAVLELVYESIRLAEMNIKLFQQNQRLAKKVRLLQRLNRKLIGFAFMRK